VADNNTQYYCPRCKKRARFEQTVGDRKYSMEALRMSYFLCGECRLIFMSKRLTKSEIKEWWERNKLEKTAPLNYFYSEALAYLYGPVLSLYKKTGYKRMRFEKRETD